MRFLRGNCNISRNDFREPLCSIKLDFPKKRTKRDFCFLHVYDAYYLFKVNAQISTPNYLYFIDPIRCTNTFYILSV